MSLKTAPLTKANAPETQVEFPETKPAVSLYQNRSFLAMLAAQLISNLGDAMHSLALIWLMNLLTGGNALWMSMVPVMQVVPRILIAPLAGVFVDRWPKLATMRISDLSSAVLVGVIAVLAYVHHLQPVVLLALTFVLTAASNFFGPAKQVLLTYICEPDELFKANAASQTLFTISTLAGPVVAGILIGTVGPYLVFAINAISFFASFLLLALIRVKEAQNAQTEPGDKQFWLELAQGMQTIKNIDTVRAVIPIALILNFLFAPMTVFIAKMVTDVFHGGAQQLSYIESGSGFGMLIGSLLVGLLAKKFNNGQLFFLGLFGCAGSLLGFSLSHTVWVGVCFAAMANLFLMIQNIAFFTVLQKQVPPDKMGRVSGLLQTGVGASMPLANFACGLVLNLVAINKLLLGIALLFFATNLYALTKKPLRTIR